eukprot:480278-Rhodomonas_salina.1
MRAPRPCSSLAGTIHVAPSPSPFTSPRRTCQMFSPARARRQPLRGLGARERETEAGKERESARARERERELHIQRRTPPCAHHLHHLLLHHHHHHHQREQDTGRGGQGGTCRDVDAADDAVDGE